MKAGGGSDSDPDEKEAADQELLRGCQLTHSQVFYFISVMETRHSSTLVWEHGWEQQE